MRVLADENFPRPSLEVLRKAGWDVFSIAEECPGISDEEVAALCAKQHRFLLTFDKDFGEPDFPSRAAVRQWRCPVPYHAGFSGGGCGHCLGAG